MASAPPTPAVAHVKVAVIGSGFGGLGAGVRLRRAGVTDFVILERADAVGGTWRDNTYPGCACDVPSHLYSLSFAPNSDWPRSFSGQPHIRAYLEKVTDTFGLRPHLRFNAEVIHARWDADAVRWHITTTAGEWTADALISAAGPLADPQIPDIPGLADFPGRVFHSSRWDHDYDLTGKRVAMVGTGASAIQIVPNIQPKVGRRTLAEEWKDGSSALRGTTVHGFPNLFMVIGPSTGLGNSSVILIIESQLNYIIDALTRLKELGAAAIHPRPEAQRRWTDEVQRRMRTTVWETGGCTSWYQDANGRNTTVWPGTTSHFRRATRRIDPAEYELVPHPVAVPADRTVEEVTA